VFVLHSYGPSVCSSCTRLLPPRQSMTLSLINATWQTSASQLLQQRTKSSSSWVVFLNQTIFQSLGQDALSFSLLHLTWSYTCSLIKPLYSASYITFPSLTISPILPSAFHWTLSYSLVTVLVQSNLSTGFAMALIPNCTKNFVSITLLCNN